MFMTNIPTKPYTDIDPNVQNIIEMGGGLRGLGGFSAVKKAIYIFCDFEICYAYNNVKLDDYHLYLYNKILNKIFIYVYFVLDLL